MGSGRRLYAPDRSLCRAGLLYPNAYTDPDSNPYAILYANGNTNGNADTDSNADSNTDPVSNTIIAANPADYEDSHSDSSWIPYPDPDLDNLCHPDTGPLCGAFPDDGSHPPGGDS